jgi:hypothetical protein
VSRVRRWYSWMRPPRRSRRWIVPTHDPFWWLVRVGRTTFKGRMRPLPVVMVDVDAEHAFEAASEEPEPGRATEAAHNLSAAIADSREGPYPRTRRSRARRAGSSPGHATAAVAMRPALGDVPGATHSDRARSPGVGAQCGMISTSIGKYCGAPPSGGGPPITSASAGPSFCSMKRSKASRDSQMS